MYIFYMLFQVARLREILGAVWAGMWFLPCVDILVSFQVVEV